MPHDKRHQGGMVRFNHRRFGRDICVVQPSEAKQWRAIFTKPPAQRSPDELTLVDATLASRVQFFFKLPRLQRLGLYKVCRFVHLHKGETLFHQGDVGHKFYIILMGMVDCNIAMAKTHNIEDMAKIAQLGSPWHDAVDFTTVATLGPMQTFGERALEDPDCKRKAAVVGVEDTWLLAITGKDYHSVQEEWRTQQIMFISKALSQSTVFGGWSPEAVNELSTHATVRVVQPGEVLVEQEAQIEDVFVVASGQCKAVRRLAVETDVVRSLEVVGGSLWRHDTEYEVHNLPNNRTEISIALRHLGKFDVFGVVSAINLTASPFSLVADTRVEVLELHRDDVVSLIAAGHAPASTFEVACRVESCMYPKDDVLLRRLRDEYNWKLYKYSLLQHSLTTKDENRPRERRRLMPGALPKPAAAAEQYLPRSLSPRMPPATAERNIRRSTAQHRKTASPHIASVYGHPTHKPLPPDEEGSPDRGKGHKWLRPNFRRSRARTRSQATTGDRSGNDSDGEGAGNAAAAVGLPAVTGGTGAQANAGANGGGMYLLTPLRSRGGDQAVLSRVPEAWKLQRQEQVQWRAPTPKRRHRGAASGGGEADTRSGADTNATPASDGVDAGAVTGRVPQPRPPAGPRAKSAITGASRPRVRVPRPPGGVSPTARGRELAARARLASAGRVPRRPVMPPRSSPASTLATPGLAPMPQPRGSVSTGSGGGSGSGRARQASIMSHRSTQSHASGAGGATPASVGSRQPRALRKRVPQRPTSTSVHRRVAMASKRAAAARERRAMGQRVVSRGVMRHDTFDSFAERHVARKKGRTRRQPSNRSLVSLSSVTGSMFTVATMREELALAMGLAAPEKPALVRSIPRTPLQTREIYRQFVSGGFNADGFSPVLSLVPSSMRSLKHGDDRHELSPSLGGSRARDRSWLSATRGSARKGGFKAVGSRASRRQGSKHHHRVTGSGFGGSGSAIARDIAAIAEGDDADSDYGSVIHVDEEFIDSGDESEGSSDEVAENEIQDAFFEVFGVTEADVEGRELTQDELDAVPRWWYKRKGAAAAPAANAGGAVDESQRSNQSQVSSARSAQAGGGSRRDSAAATRASSNGSAAVKGGRATHAKQSESSATPPANDTHVAFRGARGRAPKSVGSAKGPSSVRGAEPVS